MGLALAAGWSLQLLTSPAKDEGHRLQRRRAMQRSRAGQIVGFVDYPVVEFAGLANLVTFRLDEALGQLEGMLGSAVQIISPGEGEGQNDTLGEVIGRWRQQAAGQTRLLHLNACAAELFSGARACLRAA